VQADETSVRAGSGPSTVLLLEHAGERITRRRRLPVGAQVLPNDYALVSFSKASEERGKPENDCPGAQIARLCLVELTSLGEIVQQKQIL
jgi:hypothetical protein